MKLYAIVNQNTGSVELDSSSLERAKAYCEELFKDLPPGTVLHIYKYMMSAEKPSVVFSSNGVCKRTRLKRQKGNKGNEVGTDTPPTPKRRGRKPGTIHIPWTAEERVKLVSLGRSGLTYDQAAARIGRSPSACQKQIEYLHRSEGLVSPFTAKKGANSK